MHTGLAMMLAEELDADWSRVQAVHGNADPAYNDPAFGMHITGGSTAIKHSYTQYRELGARTRAMLMAAAATQWNVRRGLARAPSDGVVIGPGGKKLTYGELADAAMKQPVPVQVTLKDPSRFSIIGQPTTRLDAKAKSSGRQSYGIDMRLPGMLTAVVAHPPVFAASQVGFGRRRCCARRQGRKGRVARAAGPRRRRRGRGGRRLLGREAGPRRA